MEEVGCMSLIVGRSPIIHCFLMYTHAGSAVLLGGGGMAYERALCKEEQQVCVQLGWREGGREGGKDACPAGEVCVPPSFDKLSIYVVERRH